jgi:hypothetical protein
MSNLGDYEGEMAQKKLSDREIEHLLSGNDPVSSLAPFLQLLTDRNVPEVSDDEVAAFARQAAEITRSADGSASDRGRVVRVRRIRFLRPRLATALGLALALGGTTGVAIASDHAAPGDRLYGLDRALEVVGIGNGGAAERIAEAQALFAGGLVSEALTHAASAVDQTEVGDHQAESSADALRDAADAVTSTDHGNADEIRTRVAEMLEWMATNATSEEPVSGSKFGEMVAGFAKGISGQSDDNPGGDGDPDVNPGPPEGVPDGPPEGVPPGPPVRIPVGP